MHFVLKNNVTSNKIKTFVIQTIHQMHEKFDFEQVIEGWRLRTKTRQVQSDDKEKSAEENHVIVFD